MPLLGRSPRPCLALTPHALRQVRFWHRLGSDRSVHSFDLARSPQPSGKDTQAMLLPFESYRCDCFDLQMRPDSRCRQPDNWMCLRVLCSSPSRNCFGFKFSQDVPSL